MWPIFSFYKFVKRSFFSFNYEIINHISIMKYIFLLYTYSTINKVFLYDGIFNCHWNCILTSIVEPSIFANKGSGQEKYQHLGISPLRIIMIPLLKQLFFYAPKIKVSKKRIVFHNSLFSTVTIDSIVVYKISWFGQSSFHVQNTVK